MEKISHRAIKDPQITNAFQTFQCFFINYMFWCTQKNWSLRDVGAHGGYPSPCSIICWNFSSKIKHHIHFRISGIHKSFTNNCHRYWSFLCLRDIMKYPHGHNHDQNKQTTLAVIFVTIAIHQQQLMEKLMYKSLIVIKF